MFEILREEPLYTEILNEGRQEALEGEIQTLLFFIQTRFPALMQLAEEQSRAIKTLEQMQDLLRKVIVAQNEQQVLQCLLNVEK